MFSSSRFSSKKLLQLKVDESSETFECVKPMSMLILRCKRENNVPIPFISSIDSKTKLEQKLANSISDLISLHGSGSSILIDFKTHEPINIQTQNVDMNLTSSNKKVENDNVLKDSSKLSSYIKYPLVPAKTFHIPSNTKPFTINPNRYRPILPASSPSKYLPRLLCRNRSFNDANSATNNKGSNLSGNSSGNTESGQSLNQTGIIFKKVDKLFEKIKSSPSLDQTTANLLSKMISFSSPKHTKISPKLLEFRPKSISNNTQLYKDEQAYFKSSKMTSYELYDPFSDKNLILDLYNKPNYTRDFVDTICTVVNNMVNVISIANNEKVVGKNTNVNNSNNSSNKNNIKLISNEIFSKPHKTVTILPKPSNMSGSNNQVINSILSKPSVIIINNNNNNTNKQSLNTTTSPGSITATNVVADFNKKIQNPFITAIKSNLNYNIQQSHQPPQSDLQSKTIVKCN